MNIQNDAEETPIHSLMYCGHGVDVEFTPKQLKTIDLTITDADDLTVMQRALRLADSKERRARVDFLHQVISTVFLAPELLQAS